MLGPLALPLLNEAKDKEGERLWELYYVEFWAMRVSAKAETKLRTNERDGANIFI